MGFISKIYKQIVADSLIECVVQIVSIACIIFAIQIWQFNGFGFISFSILLIGVFAGILCCVLATRKKIFGGEICCNIFIGFILGSFALIMLLNSFGEIEIYLGNLVFKIMCIFLSVMLAVYAFYLASVIGHLNAKKLISKFFKGVNWKNVLLVCVFFTFLLTVFMNFFNLWPRWDSFVYCKMWERISLVNLFQSKKDGMIIAGHPAGAYALLGFLFDAIFDMSSYNLFYLSNIFLLFIDYLIICQIFKKLCKNQSPYIYSVLSFTFILSPYILGMVTCNSPEPLGLTGIILFLWAYLSNNYYVCIISCYIVCNSRETGIPVMAVLIFIQLIYDICLTQKRREKIWSFSWLDHWVFYISALMVGGTSFLNYLSVNWGKNAGIEFENLYYNDGTKMFEITFSMEYICDELKGIFLTNFTWVYLIFIFVACFYATKDNKKKVLKKFFNQPVYVMASIGMIVALVEMCLFLTHHNYRYYTATVLFIQILGLCGCVYICSKINSNVLVQNMPLIIFGILLFIHCNFSTIDPIMLAVFPTINTGNAKIAVMPWNINGLPEVQFLECARYNFQVPYFDKALDRLYSRIDAKHSKILLYDGYQWGTGGGTMNSIWGHGYEYYNPPMWGVWNSEGHYRELSYDPDYIINPIPISDCTQITKYLQEYENLYYLELPWGDELITILKETCLGMELCETVEYHGWVLKLYKF